MAKKLRVTWQSGDWASGDWATETVDLAPGTRINLLGEVVVFTRETAAQISTVLLAVPQGRLVSALLAEVDRG